MSEQNREYANQPLSFADDSPMQITKRELQGTVINPRFWIGFAVVVLILAVVGPFNTVEVLGFSERLVFWALMGISTYILGAASAIAFNAVFFNTIPNAWVRQICAGVISSIPTSIVVWFINVVVFRFDLGGWAEFLNLSAIVAVISTSMAILYKLIARPGEEVQPTEVSNAATSPFLKRLPVELGKNLLHISSEDHYVRAVTDRGSHMVLMRFSDAIAELEAIPGIQVHRSHWVAEKAAQKVIKDNGRKMLLTIDGCKFPVSRSFAKEVADRLATL